MGRLARLGALAVQRKGAADAGPVREFLSVVLGKQLYAVALTQIYEILTPPPLTMVPRAPEHVVGVCSVRGQLVTVVELRRQLRVSDTDAVRRSKILLTHIEGETIGYLVDEVRQVVRLTDSQVEPATSALGAEVPEYVLGIGRQGEQVFIILDLKKLLSR